MPAYFALGVVALVAALYGLRWLTQVSPATLARSIKYSVIVLGIIGLILLAVVGRLGLLFLLAPPALYLWRQWQRQRMAADIGATGQGRTSGIETAWLSVSLDHDSGTVEGRVKEGTFKGRRLAELTKSDLEALLEEVRDKDSESVAVLETYLDRVHPDWRTAAAGTDQQSGPKPSAGTMSREEALEVLGLAPGATPEEIRAAHHRLMLKVHPDHGGSSYLAARLNEARDRLLVN